MKIGKRYLHTLCGLVCLTLLSCTSDYNEFCTQYQVSFSCDITNVPYNALNSMGQFITIRKKTGSTSCSVYNPALKKTTEVPLSEIEMRSFTLGLGGLIVGQPYFGDGKSAVYAYDLACPACDKASSRLTVDASGNAECAKCGNTYDLNNGGLVTNGEGRPLYRYRVTQSSVSTLYIHN
ncbi:MAG: hypothetical protein IK011_00295 [Bacteroidaceae bacterium]|nr:hypothetical protein [Bacteroidaceae bacterium]